MILYFKYSQAFPLLYTHHISNVSLHILNYSPIRQQSCKILSIDLPSSSISIIPELIFHSRLILHIFNYHTSFTSLISFNFSTYKSQSNPHGVEFVITLMQSLAIGMVVNMTRTENKKVHMGSIMTQLV